MASKSRINNEFGQAASFIAKTAAVIVIADKLAYSLGPTLHNILTSDLLRTTIIKDNTDLVIAGLAIGGTFGYYSRKIVHDTGNVRKLGIKKILRTYKERFGTPIEAIKSVALAGLTVSFLGSVAYFSGASVHEAFIEPNKLNGLKITDPVALLSSSMAAGMWCGYFVKGSFLTLTQGKSIFRFFRRKEFDPT